MKRDFFLFFIFLKMQWTLKRSICISWSESIPATILWC